MSQRKPLVLTDELIEIGRKATYYHVRNLCPKFVEPEDVWQEICLKLVSQPEHYDPSRGASEATLLRLIVYRAVLKHKEKAKRNRERFQQTVIEDKAAPTKEPIEDASDWLRYIDCEESRRFCELMLECNFNKSEVARRLGWGESKVRSRFKLLAPRLLKGGFDPSRFMEVKE